MSVIGVLPFGVSATDEVEIVWLEDGGYIEIVTETSLMRVANTVSGSKTYQCYDSNGNLS